MKAANGAAFQDGETFLTIDGLRLRVATSGCGPPLLLLNGLGASLERWKPLLFPLRNRTLIAVDAPGTGLSSTPLPPMSIGKLADLHDRLLRELGLEIVDLLGFSFGGAVAQALAYRHPGRVRRLVLVATGPGLGGWPASPAAASELLHPWRYWSPPRLRLVAPFLYGGRMRDPDFAAGYADRSIAVPPSLIGYWTQVSALVGWSSLPWLHLISAQTLVIAGDDDPISPPKNAELLANCIPDAVLQLVSGGGHLFLFDSTDRVAPAIHRFLGAAVDSHD